MKIVHLAGWYFPEGLGGTEVYVAALARRLRGLGHEVLVAAPDPGLPPGGPPRRYLHEEVPVFRYPIPARPTRREAQGEEPVRGSSHLHAWLDRERPDVAHFHSFVTGLGLFELRAARAAARRVLVTSHTSGLGLLCQRGTLMRWGTTPCDGICRPAKCAACDLTGRGLPRPLAAAAAAVPARTAGRLLSRLPGRAGTVLGMTHLISRNQWREREIVAAADRFVLLTAWSLAAVAANGLPRHKLALNRLGLAWPAHPKPGPGEAPARPPLTAGYLGRFDPVKGVQDLVRALRCLPPELPLRLELRGPEGSERERRVRAEIGELAGGDPRLRLAPAVPPEQVPEILAGYDLLVCPSLCHEGGPTVAIEARAVGTPVVGSRIGGLAELVRDRVDGRLVAPGDWRALAGVLREVVERPAETLDAWRRALPRPRTMDEVTSDYLALYEETS